MVDLNGTAAGTGSIVIFTRPNAQVIAPAGTITDAENNNITSLTLVLTARPDGDAAESLWLNPGALSTALFINDLCPRKGEATTTVCVTAVGRLCWIDASSFSVISFDAESFRGVFRHTCWFI